MSDTATADQTNHPDHEALIAHAAGELEQNETMVIVAHLVGCDLCARTVARFAAAREAVRTDDAVAVPMTALTSVYALFTSAQPGIAGRVQQAVAPLRRLVAEITFDSWGKRAPGFAAVRGAADGRQFSWSAGDLDIDVQVLPAEPGAASHRLVGQIGGQDGPVVSVALARENGQQVALARPDEFGAFALEAPVGAYDLEMIVDGALVIVPGVEIG
ncbi:MAG: hypothetical protein ACR2J8_14620 [Thermomicrobiales bacterium]